MRANLAKLDDPVAASRASSTVAVERLKQEQERKDSAHQQAQAAMKFLLLADSANVVWSISVDTKGTLVVMPYKETHNAPPAKL